MRWLLAWAVIQIGLGATPAAAAVTLPAGWREPTVAESAAWLRKVRQALGPAYVKSRLSVAADFDGDGRKDRAAFLLNDRRREFALFVKRASQPGWQRLDYDGRLDELSNSGLGLEPPGVYEPFPAENEDGEPAPTRRVRARWPAIAAEWFESSYIIFFWDGRRFRKEWLGD